MALDKPGRAEVLERIKGHWNGLAATVSLAAILLHLLLRYLVHSKATFSSFPLWVAIIAGGLPLLYGLILQMWKGQFGADFLAGLSIITAALTGELLVATIIVLMLSGGQTLEEFATRRASSVLNALASRMPSIAHRMVGNGTFDIQVAEIRIGDRLIVFPHEICPVDGTVDSGTGTMDESFLTGEPFRIRKITGDFWRIE
jgi:cation transport ATPase